MNNSKKDRKDFYDNLYTGKKMEKNQYRVFILQKEIPMLYVGDRFQKSAISNNIYFYGRAISGQMEEKDQVGIFQFEADFVENNPEWFKEEFDDPSPQPPELRSSHNEGQLNSSQIEAVWHWMLLDIPDSEKNLYEMPKRFKEDFSKHLKEPLIYWWSEEERKKAEDGIKESSKSLFDDYKPKFKEERPAWTPLTPYGEKLFLQSLQRQLKQNGLENSVYLGDKKLIDIDLTDWDKPAAPQPHQIQTAPPYTFTHGQRFKAKFYDEEVEGVVSLSDEEIQWAYLCQNKVKGEYCPNKELFGFNYSYAINIESLNEMKKSSLVTDLILYPPDPAESPSFTGKITAIQIEPSELKEEEWTLTNKLRWHATFNEKANMFPMELQQQLISSTGQTKWADVPTE